MSGIGSPWVSVDSLTKYALIGGGVLLALAGAFFALNAWEKRIDSAAYERGKNEVRAEVDAKAVKAEEEQRKIEQERQAKQREALDNAEKEKQQAMADNARSAATARSLRNDIAAYREREARSNPTTCPTSKAEALIGELLGFCGERLSFYAGEAQQSRLAGLTCEAQYRALEGKVP